MLPPVYWSASTKFEGSVFLAVGSLMFQGRSALKTAVRITTIICHTALALAKGLILPTINVAFSTAKAITIAILSDLKDITIAILSGHQDIATAILPDHKDFAIAILSGLKDVAIAILSGLKDVAIAILSGLKDIATAIFSGPKDVTIAVVSGLKDIATAILSTVKDIMVVFLSTLKDILQMILITVIAVAIIGAIGMWFCVNPRDVSDRYAIYPNRPLFFISGQISNRPFLPCSFHYRFNTTAFHLWE